MIHLMTIDLYDEALNSLPSELREDVRTAFSALLEHEAPEEAYLAVLTLMARQTDDGILLPDIPHAARGMRTSEEYIESGIRWLERNEFIEPVPYG